MKYLKCLAAFIAIFIGPIALAHTETLPQGSGTFIEWQSLPSVPTTMTLGTPVALTYSVINNNFAPSLPLTVSVSHASGGSTPTITANTCQTPLAIGHSCSFTVDITPTASDIAAGIQDIINVSYDGRGSPLTSAINAAVTSSVTATLTGPAAAVQTSQVSGTTQNIVYTLTNTSNQTITSINTSGIASPETVVNLCGSTLAPSASCYIAVQVAPQASSIGTTLAAATLNVDYGGSASASVAIPAIAITAPNLAIATSNGAIYTLPSSELGTGTWQQVSSLGTTDTFAFRSILGLATLNSDEQALNPTLLTAGKNVSVNAKPLVYSVDNGTTWSQTNDFPSASTTPFVIFSQAYDGNQYLMSAGCTSTNGSFCASAPSFWYTTRGDSQQGTWTLAFDAASADVMTPYALAYGNGYFVSALAVFAGGAPQIAYGTSPIASWTTSTLNSIDSSYFPTSLAYANHKWVMTMSRSSTSATGAVYYAAVGDDKPPVATSWQAATGPAFVKKMIGVVYDTAISKFIAVGYDASSKAYVYTSSEGSTWSSGTLVASNFVPTGITYSQSTGVVVIAGYSPPSEPSAQGAVLYNAGSDMTTGWQQMRDITALGSLPSAIASATQT